MRSISNGLDPAPFRAWAEKRIADTPTPSPGSHRLPPVEKLAFDLDLAKKTLAGWRFVNETLDRLSLEEALGNAGVEITEVYPDLEELPELKGNLGPPPGFGSKLTDDQVRVLHRLHTERDLSIRELGRRIYEQVGYASAAAAEFGIRRSFRRLCLSATWRHPSTLPTVGDRLCTDSNRDGEPCEAFAMEGSDLCWPHANRELARQRIAAANEVRIGAAA